MRTLKGNASRRLAAVGAQLAGGARSDRSRSHSRPYQSACGTSSMRRKAPQPTSEIDSRQAPILRTIPRTAIRSSRPIAWCSRISLVAELVQEVAGSLSDPPSHAAGPPSERGLLAIVSTPSPSWRVCAAPWRGGRGRAGAKRGVAASSGFSPSDVIRKCVSPRSIPTELSTLGSGAVSYLDDEADVVAPRTVERHGAARGLARQVATPAHVERRVHLGEPHLAGPHREGGAGVLKRPESSQPGLEATDAPPSSQSIAPTRP